MITNTTQRAYYNPFLSLIEGTNIESEEKKVQTVIVNSKQLPSCSSSNDREYEETWSQYEKMGLKVLGLSKVDNIFTDVILPEGWKITSTSHSMWNELLDEKNRKRASIFYKAAFYDRSTFICFNKKITYEVKDYLSSDESGSFKTKKINVRNPLYDDYNNSKKDKFQRENLKRHFYFDITPPVKFIEEEYKVWIKKYKKENEEENHIPFSFFIKDVEEIIFQSKPFYFKKKFPETGTNEEKFEWYEELKNIKAKLRKDADSYLELNFPEWNDINSYWN